MIFLLLLGGVLINSALFIIYFILKKKTENFYTPISWKTCFLSSLKIYLIAIFLGSLLTVFIQNISNFESFIEFFMQLISSILGLTLYAFLFSFVIVIPALTIGIRILSLRNKSFDYKNRALVLICLILVFVINLLMSGFFTNPSFMIFLAGYSIMGVLSPWFIVSKDKIFEMN